MNVGLSTLAFRSRRFEGVASQFQPYKHSGNPYKLRPEKDTSIRTMQGYPYHYKGIYAGCPYPDFAYVLFGGPCKPALTAKKPMTDKA